MSKKANRSLRSVKTDKSKSSVGVTIRFFLYIMVAGIISSCSSDPFVGQWVPDNDRTGKSIIEIKSDGSVQYILDADDGSASISGTWNRVDGSDNKITVKYDESTVEAEADNPLVQELLAGTLAVMAQSPLPMSISDDGKELYAGGNGCFVKY